MLSSKPPRAWLAAAALALAIGGITQVPASAAPEPSPIDPYALATQKTFNSVSFTDRADFEAGRSVLAYVDLPHAISLDSATEFAVEADVPIMGFGFTQPDETYGEFYPTLDYTYEDFKEDFAAAYGTDPQITRVATIAQDVRTGLGTSRSAAGLEAEPRTGVAAEVTAAASKYPSFEAKEPTRLGVFDTQIRAGQDAAEAEEAARTASASNLPVQVLVNGGTDWPGSYVDIYAMNMGSSRAIGTWTQWEIGTGRSPQNLPTDWGLEFNSYTNWDGAIGIRPLCTGTSYFWQTHTVEYWAMTPLSGTLGSLQPYLDSVDATDSCKVRDSTIGVGAPRNIGTTGGHSQVATTIQTTVGNDAVSPAGFYWQAVSHDCIGAAASYCMGLNTDRALPPPLDPRKSRVVFNPTMGKNFPGCYRWSVSNPTVTNINCFTGE